jgi:RES domain
MAPNFKSPSDYRKFAEHVLRSARYVRDRESEEFLTTLVAQAHERRFEVPQGSNFWRAQLGQGSRPYYEGDEYIDDFPDPLPPERMKPLSDRAREGRANPKGIPYLYAATKKETAIAEVRPWLGLTVSLAQVKALRDLVFVDCTRAEKPNRLSETPMPEEKRDDAVWWAIDRAFSQPVTPSDDTADYVPTQVIAEAFKVNGFDGIVYHSSFGGGHNFVIFDLEAADVINCSLYEIKDIKFDFKETTNPYFVSKYYPKKDGT